jgi:hypothetical protein
MEIHKSHTYLASSKLIRVTSPLPGHMRNRVCQLCESFHFVKKTPMEPKLSCDFHAFPVLSYFQLLL